MENILYWLALSKEYFTTTYFQVTTAVAIVASFVAAFLTEPEQ